ncbi:MAG: hypothetical protein OZ921_04065 [Sorangiineae bacterium]|nr:hypothetical protein [Polyangiaceae bacterium]MEB2321666.1 hypothetical protein [Sorangiineae bacterium]
MVRALAGKLRASALSVDGAFALFVLASLVACAWIVRHVDSPYGDLIRVHTDHLHHVRATWTFWNVGWDVYREPFGVTAPLAPLAVVPRIPWPDFPLAYPPGMFLVFALPTWFGATHPAMPPETFAKWTIFWVVLLSHVGLFGMWRALSRRPGGRFPLILGLVLLTWRMSLHGFYDAIWLGAAAMSVAALAERRFDRSLLWFSAAIFLNYRAASFAPVAAWAGVSLLASPESPRRKVATLLVAAATGALVVWTFLMFRAGSPPHDSAAYRAAASHLAEHAGLYWFVIASSVAAAAVALVKGDALAAVMVLWGMALTTVHSGHSWHSTILVGACLTVGATRRAVPVAFLRNVLTMWMFGLWAMVFENPIFASLRLVLERAKFK